MSKEEFIKKYKLENAEEHLDQSLDGVNLYIIYLTDDIELCYWASKDYELKEISLDICKDGDCDYTTDLSVEDGLKLRNNK